MPVRSGIRVICSVLSAVAVITAVQGCGAAIHSRPNVVLIIIDTLRADFLGCYGSDVNASPEIDSIAGRGVLFERTLAQCSWTRPSIASLITSRYPRTLGIYKEKYDTLADGHYTLAEILKQDGDVNLPRSGDILGWVLRKAESVKSGPVYVQINIMEVHSPPLVLPWNRWYFDHVDVNVDEDEPPARRSALEQLVRGTYCAVKQVSWQLGSFIDALSSLPGWGNTLFVITSDHGQGPVDHPDVHDAAHHGNLLYDSRVRVPLILYNPADGALVRW